ncbi:MAG TPA: hypothetical protein DEG17_08880 [Cyanobacteria bacterium UBA11149]|nr:hypothetical protein [Cyanobacteria bacterium UBA11367]HBE60420.1 hypothetical protein [Cyanobacteria bacterium UBA11366]HBK64153.1 hypothetical protein [Cyanobacteria bacterium UBA11166]HBR75331.1 hypothetical protein [Cyanobacteria bacterium UBA11159]HBS70476.1 hypothetical protein [Cyanobacteria bacterium UBA11153]HBW88969.1 hypothetical protein [Cyanobacteria bacterium UBA11149]HCA97275.1 hypothetical protein [Cyanobacteria bacterium UBA9226]
MKNMLSILIHHNAIYTDRLFMPDSHNHLWESGLGNIHVVWQVIIAIAFCTISILLVHSLRRGQDFLFPQIWSLLSSLMITGGISHLVDGWRLWHDRDWLSGLPEVTIAVVSIYTAVIAVFFMPKVLFQSDLAAQNQKFEAEIAEYKQAKAALQESEARFQAFMNHSPSAAWICDHIGRIFYLNPAYLNIFNPQKTTGENWLGKTFAQIHPLDLNKKYFNQFKTVIDTGKLLTTQEKLTTADGSMRDFIIYQFPLLKESDLQLIGGIAMDITDQVKAKQVLQELNEELEARVKQRTAKLETITTLQEAILDSTDYAIIFTDSGGIIKTFNKGAEKMFGYSEEEIIGKVTPILFHDSGEVKKRAEILGMDLNKTIGSDFEVVVAKARAGITSEEEWSLIRKDGSRFPASLSIAPLSHPTGEVIGFVGMAKDISRTKEIETQLIAREAHLKAAQRLANLGSWEFNVETQEVIWSEETFHIFGRDPAAGSMTYAEFSKTIHPEYLPRHQFLFQRSLTEHESYQYENRIYRPDGTLRYLLVRAEVILGDDGSTKQLVGTVLDITEQKEKEAEFRDLSERLQLALASGKFGIWEHDIIQNQQIWDDRMYELYGVNPDDFSCSFQAWLKLIYPDDREPLLETMRQVVEEGKEYDAEFRIIQPSGEIRFIKASGIMRKNQQGEVVAIIGVNFDITKQKEAEAKLQNLSTRLSLALKSGAIGIWEWDIPQDRLIWDDRMYQLYGIFPSETGIVYQTWANSLHPKDRAEIELISQQARRGEREFDVEFRVIHPDRTIHFIKGYAIIQRDDRGNPLKMTGINYDITQRKEMDIALRESQRRYANLAEASPVAIFQFDPAGNCTYVNHRWSEMTGQPSEKGLGLGWVETIHPEDRNRLSKIWQETTAARAFYKNEGRILRPDGSIVWFYCLAVPETDSQGNFLGYIGTLTDITQQKQTQDSLGKYAHQVEDLYNNAPCGYHSLDPKGNFLKVNETELQWLGYTRDEMIGKPILDFFTEASRFSFLKNYPRFKEQGWIKDLEYEMICKDGTILPVTINAVAVKDETGKYIYNRATLFDIRERKKAELALKKQARREQLLRAITHRVRQSLDVDEILTVAVAEVRKIFQADRALIFQILPEGTGKIIREDVAESHPLLGDGQWEDLCLHPDSVQHYYISKPRIVVDVAMDEWGQCLGKTLQRLGIRSKISAPIIQKLENGSQIWGLLIVHACGKYRQWLPEEAGFLQQISNQLAIAIQQANLYQRVQSELIERKQAESRLRKINQELELANTELARVTRLKDEFLANMSHELRTPLNAILGMSEGLQESVFGIINQEQKKAITTIDRSGKHLLELINDILDLSKIESGKLELQLGDVPIASICEASLAFIKQTAKKKNIQIHTSIPHHLDSIEGDERRLRQVLINLLSNAVKFTPNDGSITLVVQVEKGEEFTGNIQKFCTENHPEKPETSGAIAGLSAYSPSLSISTSPQRLCFSVIDTGIGIAPEDMGKLFQAFVQIDSSLNRQYSGTGLGLALVQQIAALHGGNISVTSQVGKGSCFCLRLPYHGRCEVLPRKAGSQLPNPSTSENPVNTSVAVSEMAFKDPLILLVEDNPANVNTISAYLESRGYRLIIAKDGYEAVSLAERENPNLILMDIQMPGMDGLEAMRRIRDRGQTQVPIIALTALAMTGDREKCIEAGANEYLTKPIKFKQLTATIQQLLLQSEEN